MSSGLPHDWQIILAADDTFELQFQDPSRLQWHCMYEAPTPGLCKQAYDDYYAQGETPPAEWSDL